MATTYAETAAPPDPMRRLRDRIAPPMPPDVLVGWLGPLVVALVAFFARLHRLGTPPKQAFDEVYYQCDAKMLMQFGYEHSHLDPLKEGCIATDQPSFVVHPPLGKWLIALGQKAVDGPDDPFSWRISAVVFGTLAVLILARTARRMFRSTLLGCIAGALLALDGLHFVQSRVAMLDIFLMFFVVAAFGALVVDRDQMRQRLADRVGEWPTYPGPAIGFRPWRLVAGGCLGAAVAVKWSAIFVVVTLVLLSLAWDVGARRAAGIPRPFSATFWGELGVLWSLGVLLVIAKGLGFFGVLLAGALLGLLAWRAVAEHQRRSVHSDHPLAGTLLPVRGSLLLLVCLVAPVVYVGSWAGWFATEGGWRRSCVEEPAWQTNLEGCGLVTGFLAYHEEIYNFHDNLGTNHPYQSSPWSWLLLGKPVSYFYETPEPETSQEILGIGTPAIWWGSIAALAVTAWGWASRRDWRASAILVGFAAGYLPWFAYSDRTMFLFYALPALPFMCLALTYALGLAMGRSDASPRRRTIGTVGVGVYLAAVVLNFIYLYPLLSAEVIPYSSWRDHIWFNSWI